tara:strand:- start:251 stop:502 length:252 start_codon:yes stop_codon:yes gene_type:complete
MNVDEILRLKKAVAKTIKNDCKTIKSSEVKVGDTIVWNDPTNFKTSLVDEVKDNLETGYIDYLLEGKIICRRERSKEQIIKIR